MKERALDLPEAYLELQVEKGRSFFVYQSDLGILKRVEAQLAKDREREREARALVGGFGVVGNIGNIGVGAVRGSFPLFGKQNSNGKRDWQSQSFSGSVRSETGAAHPYARSPRNSISYPAPPQPTVVPSQAHAYGYGYNNSYDYNGYNVYNNSYNGYSGYNGYNSYSSGVGQDGGSAYPYSSAHVNGVSSVGGHSLNGPSMHVQGRRPRARTSPLLPPHVDHQTWFNDPRFDGSFPSRVLPFLYLGNLYVLHFFS